MAEHDDRLPRDPRFPDRPDTLDFARLSSAVNEQDAVADALDDVQAASSCDLGSLVYMAKGRIDAALDALPLTKGTLLAIYLDAFQLGVGFQARGGHRDEPAQAGEGSEG